MLVFTTDSRYNDRTMSQIRDEQKEGGEFGAYLRELRHARRLTLREVEVACGVSNSYLSQLEHGSIRQPRPNVLQKLAQVYGVPYEMLMTRAGYIGAGVTAAAQNAMRDDGAAPAPTANGANTPGWAFSIPDDLSATEEIELQNFLEYLKFKRQGR